MPYMIVKSDGKFSVHKQNEDKTAGELLHSYDNEKEAEDYMKALYANTEDKSISPIEKTAEPVMETMNLSYAKSLGIEIPDMAVKYVSRDLIRHPVFLWGDPKQTDVELEYFKKTTDFWDKEYVDLKRPLTWDHAQDPEWKNENPVIGMTLEFEDDDVARWAISKLERNRKYRKAIDELIEKRSVGSSSDSVPQYVIRQKSVDGKSYLKSGAGDWLCEEDGTAVKSVKPSATYLKRWPWIASALTDTPAEPRMNGSVEWFKSLGLTLPDVPDLEREALALKARYLKLFIS